MDLTNLLDENSFWTTDGIHVVRRMFRLPFYHPVRLSMEWLSIAYVVVIPAMYLAIFWFRKNHDSNVQGTNGYISNKSEMQKKMILDLWIFQESPERRGEGERRKTR